MRTVCVGARGTVQGLVSLDELSSTFGGYIVYAGTTKSRELLGVWGARKSAALRSLLRARGAQLELKRTKPRAIRMKLRVSDV